MLRYRASKIEEFILEQERFTNTRRRNPGVELRNPLVPPQKLRNEMGKSHQSGWVVLRGKKWYGYYRRTVLDPITNERKADVVSVILGLRSQLTEGVAREADGPTCTG